MESTPLGAGDQRARQQPRTGERMGLGAATSHEPRADRLLQGTRGLVWEGLNLDLRFIVHQLDCEFLLEWPDLLLGSSFLSV